MRSSAAIALLCVAVVQGNNVDLFNYDYRNFDISGGTSYGQEEWGSVTCDDLAECAGYPEKFEEAIDFDGFTVAGDSQCQWCKEGEPESCGQHRQSPINLKRDRGITGSPEEKECPDWHFMRYEDGTCGWSDYLDQFRIERHALEVSVPTLANGDIACENKTSGISAFPRLDYSKGFPDWWWYDHTSITVPSSHTQEGKQYDAEVILAHFYEIKHPKNQLGYVSIFLDAYPNVASWPYLDKLICQWRKVEEETRKACGLDPAPPYGRCSLFRGQEPSDEWLQGAGELSLDPTVSPTAPNGVGKPLTSPTSAPSEASFVPTETSSETPTQSPSDQLQSARPTSKDWGKFTDLQRPGSTAPPTAAPTTTIPTAKATPAPVAAGTPRPTISTTTTSNRTTLNETDFDCDAYSDSNERMCSSDSPCCEAVRSDTEFCWNLYENVFPGDLIYTACNRCCEGGPKAVGPPAAPRDDLPKTIQCSAVESPFRVCKSCCQDPRPTTDYCSDIYTQYGDDMEQICYYCCSEPKAVGPEARYLRTRSTVEEPSTSARLTNGDNESIPAGARVTYVNNRRIVLREENFRESEESDEDFFARVYTDYKHREAQADIHDIDYDDVPYWPYEWLVKVETEYYFRYEGTMIVPPCWEVVHWRVMKDPIRVPQRQIDELNRLLAWRISPDSCEPDSAGRVSKDGNKVDLNRDVQYMHLLHRLVFCECKDWPSKFPNDREWCANWRDTSGADARRFYETPYSFDSNGQW